MLASPEPDVATYAARAYVRPYVDISFAPFVVAPTDALARRIELYRGIEQAALE